MFPAPLFGIHTAIAAIVQNQTSSSSNQPHFTPTSGYFSPADMARVERMMESDERAAQREAQWRNIEARMQKDDRVENSHNNYFNYDNYFDKNTMQPAQKAALQAAAAEAAQIKRIDESLDQTWLGCLSVITCGLCETSKKSNVIHPAPSAMH